MSGETASSPLLARTPADCYEAQRWSDSEVENYATHGAAIASDLREIASRLRDCRMPGDLTPILPLLLRHQQKWWALGDSPVEIAHMEADRPGNRRFFATFGQDHPGHSWCRVFVVLTQDPCIVGAPREPHAFLAEATDGTRLHLMTPDKYHQLAAAVDNWVRAYDDLARRAQDDWQQRQRVNKQRAKPRSKKRKKLRVADANQRMLELIEADPDRLKLSTRRWAEVLGCSNSTVHGTSMYTQGQIARERAKQERKRPNRGRRRPRHNSQA
jgi:hypothetical protein